MKARGKRKAKRARRPWIKYQKKAGSPERAEYRVLYYGPSGLGLGLGGINQGRRSSLRSSLAPGFHISRLWRVVGTFVQSQLGRQAKNLTVERGFASAISSLYVLC